LDVCLEFELACVISILVDKNFIERNFIAIVAEVTLEINCEVLLQASGVRKYNWIDISFAFKFCGIPYGAIRYFQMRICSIKLHMTLII
jgi:hypothetical protein